MRLGRLLPRYRIGTGFIYDTYDIKRFQDRYLNVRLVTVADIARMTGLRTYNVHSKLYAVRDTIAAAKGNKERRIGALYDLDNPVVQHLFALWGWDKRIQERIQDNEDNHTAAATQPESTDPMRRNAGKLKRRTRSEQGR